MRWVLRTIGVLLILVSITIFFWNDVRTYFTERVNDKVITSYENQDNKVKVNPVESWITKTEMNELEINDNMVGYLKYRQLILMSRFLKVPQQNKI